MLRFLLLLTILIITRAQIPAYMGVCYFENAQIPEVQDFCQTFPDCIYSEEKPETLNCYMRCQDELDENEQDWNCGDYGMKCHSGVVCIVPPSMLDDAISK